MNNKAFTISFIVAAMAVMAVHSYVTSTEEAYKSKFGKRVTVIVAKKNIKELDVLDESNLGEKVVPAKFVSSGAVLSKNKKDIIGSLAVAPLLKGEQLTSSKVTILGARTGLSRQIAVGKRAVTVKVSDISGVSRLIKPGDRVDLIVVIDYGKGKQGMIEAKTVMQDVMVLATGKYITNTVPGIIERDPNNKKRGTVTNLTSYTAYNNITVEVDPAAAQKLILIEKKFGGVYLTLRHNDDTAKENIDTALLADILGKNSEWYRSKKRAQANSRRAPSGGRSQ